MVDLAKIRLRSASLLPHLNGRDRGLFATSEARAAGHSGIAAVSQATRNAPSTVGCSLRELEGGEPLGAPGGRGRKTLVEQHPGLLIALLALVSPTEQDCPVPPLHWTCKSLRQLADALVKHCH